MGYHFTDYLRAELNGELCLPTISANMQLADLRRHDVMRGSLHHGPAIAGTQPCRSTDKRHSMR